MNPIEKIYLNMTDTETSKIKKEQEVNLSFQFFH